MSINEMEKLDKSSPIPFYSQLENIIRNSIEAGILTPGDKLPTEQWLSEYHNISRTTVRHAIDSLISSGTLIRSKGHCPEIASHKFNRNLSKFTDLYEELTLSGHIATSKVSDIKIHPAFGIVAKNMHVDEGEPILSFRRIRYTDGIPIADQQTFLKYNLCPDFDPMETENASMHGILQNKFKLNIEFADQSISVRPAGTRQAAELGIPKGASLILSKYTTYLDTKEIIEYSETLFVSDRYELSIRLYK